jgi:predicted deacylase
MNISQLSTPTKSELKSEFKFLKSAVVQGVPGVWAVASETPGPTVGITIHTHGNEPSGLAAAWYLRNIFGISRELLCGSVLITLNNLRATERYLRARTKPTKEAARFIGLNMNRLPNGLVADTQTYEVSRARDLLPIWRGFDAALDIHSVSFKKTAAQSRPMIIEVASHPRIETLIRRFPIDLRFSEVERFQLKKPMLSFCGNPKQRIPAIGIEAGSHESPAAFRVAIGCVLSFLGELELIRSPLRLPIRTNREHYRFVGRLLFPDDSWSLVRIFEPYESVRAGEVLARNAAGGTMCAPLDAQIMFPPPGRKPTKKGDEALFFIQRQ